MKIILTPAHLHTYTPTHLHTYLVHTTVHKPNRSYFWSSTPGHLRKIQCATDRHRRPVGAAGRLLQPRDAPARCRSRTRPCHRLSAHSKATRGVSASTVDWQWCLARRLHCFQPWSVLGHMGYWLLVDRLSRTESCSSRVCSQNGLFPIYGWPTRCELVSNAALVLCSISQRRTLNQI